MSEISLEVGSTVAITKDQFDKLLQSLQKMGYLTIGPKILDDALTYSPISALADLPQGYISEQDAGSYRLVNTGHTRYFDITPGAKTWKEFLFPPHTTLFTVKKNGNGWVVEKEDYQGKPYALIGVRACELAAIHIQDKVFLRKDCSDPIYQANRQAAFILSVDCLHPGGTCFCHSMGTGPQNSVGFDINITELNDVFLVKIGSEAGRMVIGELQFTPASAFLMQAAKLGLDEACNLMGRELLNPHKLPSILLDNLDHPQWEDVAKRCLSCASCTQVCPTCFCWDIHEKPDLTNSSSQRVRVWDSCFNPDYSYIAGGNTRPNTMSRYRQWLTHKFASWHHQFEVIGCVGCGRCITWCPAGIDITEETAAIAMETVE